MDRFEIGDLVVLTAGSMRMAVERVEGDQIAVVWCHEGQIGRDAFDARLLKRWEVREDDARGPRPSPRGDREGGSKPYGRSNERGGERPERPRKAPTGWDGKPREKKFFRKD